MILAPTVDHEKRARLSRVGGHFWGGTLTILYAGAMACGVHRLNDDAFAASPRDHAKDMIEQIEGAPLDPNCVALRKGYSVV
jgi:hypothetical protein